MSYALRNIRDTGLLPQDDLVNVRRKGEVKQCKLTHESFPDRSRNQFFLTHISAEFSRVSASLCMTQVEVGEEHSAITQ